MPAVVKVQDIAKYLLDPANRNVIDEGDAVTIAEAVLLRFGDEADQLPLTFHRTVVYRVEAKSHAEADAIWHDFGPAPSDGVRIHRISDFVEVDR